MVITNKDLMNFYGCSRPTAVKRMDEIMRYFDIPSKRIWLFHLAKYEGMTESEVKFILKIPENVK